MRYTLLLPSFLWASILVAQVSVDGPLRYTGSAGQRGVDGIAPPTEASSVITVGHASAGAQHWALGTLVGDTVVLTMAVPPSGYVNGTFLRFPLTTGRVGRTFVRVPPLSAVQLVRSDGSDPYLSDLQRDGIHEIVYAEGRFILLSALNAECPTNSVRVNDNFCIQTNRRNQVNFAQAIAYCAERGGRLCTWDEYYAGCTLMGGQLQNLHSDWEWLNDMSDHVHSADQVGRTTCRSQRATHPPNTGSARCCYSLR